MLHGVPGVPCPTGRAGLCGATSAADCRCRPFPVQVPRSQPDGLAVVLSVLEARRALWESIGAWEDLVAQWLSAPFELLRIRNEVLRKWHAAHAHAHCGV